MEKYRTETRQQLSLEKLIRTFNQFVIDVKKADDEQRGNAGLLITRLKQVEGNLRALREKIQAGPPEQLVEISGEHESVAQSLESVKPSLLQSVFHGFSQREIADEYLAVAGWLLEANTIFDAPVLERMLSVEHPQFTRSLVSALLKTLSAPHLYDSLNALNPTARERLDRLLQVLPEEQPIRSFQALMQQAATRSVSGTDTEKFIDKQRNTLSGLLAVGETETRVATGGDSSAQKNTAPPAGRQALSGTPVPDFYDTEALPMETQEFVTDTALKQTPAEIADSLLLVLQQAPQIMDIRQALADLSLATELRLEATLITRHERPLALWRQRAGLPARQIWREPPLKIVLAAGASSEAYSPDNQAAS